MTICCYIDVRRIRVDGSREYVMFPLGAIRFPVFCDLVYFMCKIVYMGYIWLFTYGVYNCDDLFTILVARISE